MWSCEYNEQVSREAIKSKTRESEKESLLAVVANALRERE